VSIAGAVITMSSDLLFTYVESNRVWMLDARAQFGKAG
jgi:hypothetical protein